MTEPTSSTADFHSLSGGFVPEQTDLPAGAELARVIRVDRGWPTVASPSGVWLSQLSDACARSARRDPFARVAVGDWVVLTHPAEHEHAVITRLLPRRTALVRRDPGAADAAQVVVSNIERIFVVAALTADAESLNLARLERGMVIAADSGADVTVVLTKADLCADADVAARRARSVAAGYEVIIESAIDGRGIAEVARLMPPGQTTALIGASGTGKSTLINRLLGHERQAVGLVRERDDKGRHTTVAREMVALPNGGVVIDTPGIRSVALWQARRGLALVFPEIEEAACTCKFSDCTHTREPGCAVAAAVAAGAIDPSRLERYRILSDEITTSAHRQR